MSSAARVLIADSHPALREGLAIAVRLALTHVIVDCVGTLDEAEAFISQYHSYRLAILALDLHGANGLPGLIFLQRRLDVVPVLILDEEISPDLVAKAHDIGVAGCVAKIWPLDRLAEAARKVVEGGEFFPAPDRKARAHQPHAVLPLDRLSDAQLRVLMALTDGRSNKQIAGDLGVCEATVKAHLSAAFRKLGIHSRTQALIALQSLIAIPSGHAAQPSGAGA